MRLIALADTHGRLHPAALEHIAARDPATILHAGDIGELTILDELGSLAPTIAVRGNIDTRSVGLYDFITLGLTSARGSVLTVLLTHIAIARTRLHRDVRTIAQAQGADLVVCGHSHIPWIGTDQGIAVLNPGSLGPKRFALPITFAVIDISPNGVDLHHVDCETGLRWRP